MEAAPPNDTPTACAGANGPPSRGTRERLRLGLPKHRIDAEFVFLLDEAAQVVREQLAQHFVLHRHVGLAPHRVPELPLHHREGGLHVAPFVVVLEVLVALEAEVVERLLEVPADRARRVVLEGDEPSPAAPGSRT